MLKKLLFFIFIILLFSPPAFAKKTKVSTPESEYKYQQKVLRQGEIEQYKRSLLPESGYMTREEYEKKSVDIPNSQKVVPEYKMPNDIKMKYVPQPIYKLTRYNNPPGSVELHIDRRYKFDKQVNGGAITSPKKDILVYPVIYYYVVAQCSAGDLFVIPLDKTVPDVSRILRANVVKRDPEPILSTDKDISEKSTFRTMTPIDFSPDGTKLIAKEKIGNSNDGIWKTNLWVYDFETKQAKNLYEIRDAIRFYWQNQEGLILDEKRWDILPLGFDANDADRVIVSAYGYTGKVPTFLGNWSIDCKGERTMLLSLVDSAAQISINGFKVIQAGVEEPAQVYNDEKKSDEMAKKKRELAQKVKKADAKAKKDALNKKLKEMKSAESAVVKKQNEQQRVTAPTGFD